MGSGQMPRVVDVKVQEEVLGPRQAKKIATG